MAQKSHGVGKLTLNKTPFGGVSAKGKSSDQALLPSRHALDLLTKGNPSQRSVMSFAERTPIGSGAPNDYAMPFRKGGA